jgi:diadenylate cyclase
VGITEVSDAVVLIVSEETGIISMAVDGRLSRFLDLKTVDKMLLNHYMSRLDRKRPGRDWIGQLFRGGRNG